MFEQLPSLSELIILLCLGAFGGLVLNVMNIIQDQKRHQNQKVVKDFMYWIIFGFWPILGAVLVFTYMVSGINVNGLMALTTGVTAPTTVQAMIDKTLGSNLVNTEEGIEEDIEESGDAIPS